VSKVEVDGDGLMRRDKNNGFYTSNGMMIIHYNLNDWTFMPVSSGRVIWTERLRLQVI
jgi:hypothetical protein